MSDANLLSALKKYDKLTGIVVIGKVRSLIEKPSIISSLNKMDGDFAIVDVFALKCLGRDYFGEESGYYDRDKIYLSCGSMLFCLKDTSLVERVIMIGSKSNLSGTIKRQVYVKDQTSGVHCFAFRKKGDGSWGIAPNIVRPVLKKDISNTVLEDYLNLEEGNFSFPKSTLSTIEYSGVTEYVEKSIEVSKSQKTLEPEETRVSRDALSRDTNGRIDVSKIDLHLVKHLQAQEKSELFDVIKDEVESLNGRVIRSSQDFVTEIASLAHTLEEQYQEKEPDEDDEFDGWGDDDEEETPEKVTMLDVAQAIRKSYIESFAEKYTLPISNRVKARGKDFVDALIASLYDIKFGDTSETENKEEGKAVHSEGVDKIKKGIAFNPYMLSSDYKGVLPILGDDYKMATLIIGNVTGVGESNLVKNFNSCLRYHKLSLGSWFHALILEPYSLGLLGSGLSVVDCDRLYLTVGRVFSGYCFVGEDGFRASFSKNMHKRNMLMVLEGIKKEEVASSNTLISISKMKSQYFKFYPDRDRSYFKENGYPMPMVNLEALRQLLSDDLNPLSPDEYIGKNPCNSNLISEMEELGIVDTVNDDYLAMAKNMYKEFVIYDTLLRKGHEETGITDSQVKDTIDSFEKSKGFNLESLQKEGISLVKYRAAVLSGCAGSGKTTTSECMSMVLENNLERYDIIYGTPTGKACRRLAEVVGGTVKTLHSLFGVGVDSEPYLVPARQRSVFNSRNIYILDEMAMCSTDLLYEVVRNLSNSDIIYFLGDIKQLPPIGRGIPFSMLMSILPCVELGVSKRAASDSLVNYNCTLINFLSDNGMEELVDDGKSFIIKDCSDERIPIETKKMFKNLMEGAYGKVYAEDDIQVITQYQDPKKSWAAPVLNPPLQEFLRSEDTLLFQNTDRKFYKNDRVIHVKRNSYEMRRYLRKSSSVFEEVVTFGAVNGEVGKLVGVIRSDMATIIPFSPEKYNEKPNMSKEEETLLERWEEKEGDLRDDASFSDMNSYFVVVEYYDNDLSRDAYVLYRSRARQSSQNSLGMDSIMYLEGRDLGNLDLAYALTAHKMQGSQSKAVIAVFGKGGYPKFVNRNMINVIITRSRDFVGMIGSVSGDDSAISRGRVEVSPRKREDILGVLAGEVQI